MSLEIELISEFRSLLRHSLLENADRERNSYKQTVAILHPYMGKNGPAVDITAFKKFAKSGEVFGRDEEVDRWDLLNAPTEHVPQARRKKSVETKDEKGEVKKSVLGTPWQIFWVFFWNFLLKNGYKPSRIDGFGNKFIHKEFRRASPYYNASFYDVDPKYSFRNANKKFKKRFGKSIDSEEFKAEKHAWRYGQSIALPNIAALIAKSDEGGVEVVGFHPIIHEEEWTGSKFVAKRTKREEKRRVKSWAEKHLKEGDRIVAAGIPIPKTMIVGGKKITSSDNDLPSNKHVGLYLEYGDGIRKKTGDDIQDELFGIYHIFNHNFDIHPNEQLFQVDDARSLARITKGSVAEKRRFYFRLVVVDEAGNMRIEWQKGEVPIGANLYKDIRIGIPELGNTDEDVKKNFEKILREMMEAAEESFGNKWFYIPNINDKSTTESEKYKIVVDVQDISLDVEEFEKEVSKSEDIKKKARILWDRLVILIVESIKHMGYTGDNPIKEISSTLVDYARDVLNITPDVENDSIRINELFGKSSGGYWIDNFPSKRDIEYARLKAKEVKEKFPNNIVSNEELIEMILNHFVDRSKIGLTAKCKVCDDIVDINVRNNKGFCSICDNPVNVSRKKREGYLGSANLNIESLIDFINHGDFELEEDYDTSEELQAFNDLDVLAERIYDLFDGEFSKRQIFVGLNNLWEYLIRWRETGSTEYEHEVPEAHRIGSLAYRRPETLKTLFDRYGVESIDELKNVLKNVFKMPDDDIKQIIASPFIDPYMIRDREDDEIVINKNAVRYLNKLFNSKFALDHPNDVKAVAELFADKEIVKKEKKKDDENKKRLSDEEILQAYADQYGVEDVSELGLSDDIIEYILSNARKDPSIIGMDEVEGMQEISKKEDDTFKIMPDSDEEAAKQGFSTIMAHVKRSLYHDIHGRELRHIISPGKLGMQYELDYGAGAEDEEDEDWDDWDEDE